MLPAKRTLRPTTTRFFNEDWNTLFDWSNNGLSNKRTTTPSVNIKESSIAFTVDVAAPGKKKEDFKVELNKNVLTISTESKSEATEGEAKTTYRRKEFNYQSFSRSFNLDNRVIDRENIAATYENGILSLTLPKREEAKEKPARTIEIS